MTSCIQADRLRPPTLLSALERRAEGAGANLCAEVLPGGAYELHRSPARQPAKQDYPIHVLQPFGDDSHRCGEVANAKWTAPCGCRFQPPGTLPRFALYLLTTSTYKAQRTQSNAKEKHLLWITRLVAVLCVPLLSPRLCVEMSFSCRFHFSVCCRRSRQLPPPRQATALRPEARAPGSCRAHPHRASMRRNDHPRNP